MKRFVMETRCGDNLGWYVIVKEYDEWSYLRCHVETSFFQRRSAVPHLKRRARRWANKQLAARPTQVVEVEEL